MAAIAAVASLLEYVTEVMKGYPELISGDAEEEFESLKDDIETLKAILEDRDSKPSEEDGGRLIQNQIREVVYEIEDEIDSWMTQAAAATKGNPDSSCSCCIQKRPHPFRLAWRARALREHRLKEVLEKAKATNVTQGSATTIKEEDAMATTTGNPKTSFSCCIQKHPFPFRLARLVGTHRKHRLKDGLNVVMGSKLTQESAITIKEEDAIATTSDLEIRQQVQQVVGREDEKQKIISHLMKPQIRQQVQQVVGRKDEKQKIISHLMKAQPELDIISIVGMAGLGKTSLALEIFNDDNIRYEFPIRIWVHISERINRRYVLLQIMKHFTSNSDDLYSMSIEELLSAVHACLSCGKFLMVMDDVWKTEHWDQLRNALPYSNASGKVLITSRDMAVCRHAQQITESHSLRFLCSDESWELLQLVVFGSRICPKELQVIGQRISEMCGGVPLTILLLGGVLKDQYLSSKSIVLVQKKWGEVASNVNQTLVDSERVISDVVAFCYERLPYHLKNCFLYLGVFPAGFEIPTWTLTRLWLAEDFIQPAEENRSLEEIAEDNLNVLISRNLLKVRKINPMGEVKACLMHDLIRVFCVHEASEQNLLLEINMSEEEDDGALQSKLEKIHRLCLHSDLDKFFSSNLKLAPRIRSFLCFREDANSLDLEHNSEIPENFRYLRVLHSKSIEFSGFPQSVTKLAHLRYIVLCVPDLMILPESLSKLRSLQTITVDTNSNLLTMEANIWEMIRLRHVKTKAAIVLDNSWQGEGGENLQMLNRLSPESVPEVSQRAINLRTLGVRGNLAPLFYDMPSGSLNRLEKLKLYQAAASENRLQRCPDWNFTPNLKRLTLSNTFLDWKYMHIFAKIAGLEVLKLKDNAFTGFSWEASSYGFMRLQFLLIVNTDMVLWEALPNTFPRLKHLVLKNCVNLKEIPDCILQRLETLEIKRVRKSAADSARNSGAQFNLTMGVACDI